MQGNDDKLLIRRVGDIAALAEKYNTPRFSDFLDEREQAVLAESYADSGGVWFGGYDGAARRMLGFFPEWCEPDMAEFPLSAVLISKKGPRTLTHRDYLGTIMSLGVERKKIGDIAVNEGGAYVFAVSDIAEHIAQGIEKIANCGVKCSIVPLDKAEIPEPEYKIQDVVAASLRADAVVGAVCGFSRKNAADFILAGYCSVNHKVILRVDHILKEGDLLSLRGFGRAQVMETGANTRSGRLHIKIKKFI